MVDYGHNPEAIRSIGTMLEKWLISGSTLVLGVPGDRSDAMIGLSGLAAAQKFQKIIIREDEDLREREPGEVPDILMGIIRGANPDIDVKVITDPKLSLEKALSEMKENELVVYLYEDLEMVRDVLQGLGGKIIHDYSRFIPLREEGLREVQAWQ
jgi:cyanophycin synthetase